MEDTACHLLLLSLVLLPTRSLSLAVSLVLSPSSAPCLSLSLTLDSSGHSLDLEPCVCVCEHVGWNTGDGYLFIYLFIYFLAFKPANESD